MASISIKSQSGTDAGTAELSDEVFGIEPNIPVMHQVVTAQLTAPSPATTARRRPRR